MVFDVETKWKWDNEFGNIIDKAVTVYLGVDQEEREAEQDVVVLEAVNDERIEV